MRVVSVAHAAGTQPVMTLSATRTRSRSVRVPACHTSMRRGGGVWVLSSTRSLPTAHAAWVKSTPASTRRILDTRRRPPHGVSRLMPSASVSRRPILVRRADGVGFDLHEPFGADEASDLHDRVRRPDLVEHLPVHRGHRLPI